jgi:hypothetical protein
MFTRTADTVTSAVPSAVVIDVFATKRAQLSRKYGTVHPALLGPRAPIAR